MPTANNDSYTVAEDNVLTVAAPGVLANDSDVDGDSLTATLVTAPTHGGLVFNADGSFAYTPQANYNGSDSFQYAARDTSGWFSFKPRRWRRRATSAAVKIRSFSCSRGVRCMVELPPATGRRHTGNRHTLRNALTSSTWNAVRSPSSTTPLFSIT